MAAPPHRFAVHAMIQHPGPAAAAAYLWSLDHCSGWGHGGIHAPVIRQQGHYYVLLCTFPPGSGCTSNPMPSSKWQCCENSWKKKVDRGGVVRLLYKQIPVRPDILSVGFGTLFPIPAHAVRCWRSPFRSYKQYPGKEGDRDW